MEPVNQKKLHLLEPNIGERYLKQYGGQRMRYLRIPMNMSLGMLKDDVQNGARQFSGIVKVAENLSKEAQADPDSRGKLIILKAKDEEFAHMAVAYLEGCTRNPPDDADMDPEESVVYSAGEMEEPEIDVLDDDEDDDDDPDERVADFDEVPIVDYDKLSEDADSWSVNNSNADMPQLMKDQIRRRKPFWSRLYGQPVIVEYHLMNSFGFYMQMREPFDFDDHLLPLANCSRIYLLVIDERNDEKDPNSPVTRHVDGILGMYRLLYLADMAKIDAGKKSIQTYYRRILEDSVAERGCEISRGVSRDRLLKAMFSVDPYDKCTFIRRCVSYVFSQHTGDGAPTKEEWESLLRLNDLNEIMERAETGKPEKKDPFESHFLFREDVRDQFEQCIAALRMQRVRYKLLPRDRVSPIHNTLLFVGAPGTGKTEGAKYLANRLFAEHLVPSNRYVAVAAAQLKGQFVGATSPQVRRIVGSADVILIDECYSLMAADKMGRTDSFSKEALAELLLLIEEHPEKVFIFAGYGGIDGDEEGDYMKRFLQENPGLQSRISMIIPFRSYTPDELVAITHHIAKQQDYRLDHSTDGLLKKYFEEKSQSKNFGNARDARNLVAAARQRAVHRLCQSAEGQDPEKLGKDALTRLEKEDVEAAVNEMLQEERNLLGRRKGQRHYGF